MSYTLGEIQTGTLNFSAAGTQSVASVNMNYTHLATHWAKLEMLAPNAMISEQAKFMLNCTSPAVEKFILPAAKPQALPENATAAALAGGSFGIRVHVRQRYG